MNPHRCAMGVVAVQLIAIVSGAFQTSSRIALGRAQAAGLTIHDAMGMAVLAGALAFCIWVWRVGAEPGHSAGWAGVASLFLAIPTPWHSPQFPAGLVWHAVFAHSSVALMTAAAVLTSPGWSKPAERVDAGSWGALRPAAFATPLAVLLQISLGALYRHQITGVMPHMFGAMVVALLTLVVSVVLLQHFADCRPVKTAATALISIVLAQVCLGIAAFIMLLLDAGNTPAFTWAATSHVTVGALTLAASVVLAMQVRRYIAGPVQRGETAAGTSTL